MRSGANGTVTVAAPRASAVLAFEPFSKTEMASADLMLLSHPLRNIRTDIHGTYRSNRFDATVVDRCIGCITSVCADAHGSDSVAVHIRKRGQVIDHRADVFRSDVRVLQLARLARAFTLVGSVKSDCDETFFRQFPSIETRRLLLNAAAGVRNYDSGVFPAFIKSLREVYDR